MRLCLMSLAIALAASAVEAAGFDPRQVPAEVQWVVHVDFDALRSATVAQQLSAEWLQRDATKKELEQVRQLIGADLLNDLHAATLFGTRFESSAGVILLQAEVDRQRVRALLSMAPDFQTKMHGSRELCTWTQRENGREKSLSACLAHEKAIVVGEDPEQVILALDTLDGKHPAVGDDSPLAVPVPEGAVLYAAACGLAEAELPFRSPLVRQAQRMFLAVGESEQEVFLKATAVARDTESAEQFRDAVAGLRALALLQAGPDPLVASLFKDFKLSVEEERVRLDWCVPAEDLVRAIQKAQGAAKKE